MVFNTKAIQKIAEIIVDEMEMIGQTVDSRRYHTLIAKIGGDYSSLRRICPTKQDFQLRELSCQGWQTCPKKGL